MDAEQIAQLPRPLAVVFGGGASLGALQVGMLRTLLNLEVEPDLLVGTSVGAINAAYMATGFDREHLEGLESIWQRVTTDSIFRGVGFRSVARVFAPKSKTHIASNEGLHELFDAYLPTSYADLKVEAGIVATDVASGDKVTFSEGDLHRHLLASAAIPGVFPPVDIDGRTHVDGGVVANVPILPARLMGAETIIALDPGYPCNLDAVPESRVGYAMHIVTLMLRQQAYGVLHFLGDDATVLYPTPPCPLDVPPHDFSRTDELIARGEETAAGFFDALTVDTPGVYGHPHFHPPKEAQERS